MSLKSFKKNENREKEGVSMSDLQIENYGLVTAKNGGRVRQQRIENAKITCVNMYAVHYSVLVHIENRPFSTAIYDYPTPRRLAFLLHRGIRIRNRSTSNRVCRHHVPISTHLYLPYPTSLSLSSSYRINFC
jgi:hypothetical protein